MGLIWDRNSRSRSNSVPTRGSPQPDSTLKARSSKARQMAKQPGSPACREVYHFLRPVFPSSFSIPPFYFRKYLYKRMLCSEHGKNPFSHLAHYQTSSERRARSFRNSNRVLLSWKPTSDPDRHSPAVIKVVSKLTSLQETRIREKQTPAKEACPATVRRPTEDQPLVSHQLTPSLSAPSPTTHQPLRLPCTSPVSRTAAQNTRARFVREGGQPRQ